MTIIKNTITINKNHLAELVQALEDCECMDSVDNSKYRINLVKLFKNSYWPDHKGGFLRVNKTKF